MRPVLDAVVLMEEAGRTLASGPIAETLVAAAVLAELGAVEHRGLGPAGFLNQCYRHSQGTTIYGGTSEIHRSMIAERALNLPRTRA
jgi:alkylation response protein AidB-like acyl-CoA dehydrogenase